MFIPLLLTLVGAHIYKLDLEYKHNQDKLVKIVNMLQKTHAELLDLPEFIQIKRHNVGDLEVQTIMVQKQTHKTKNLKHQQKLKEQKHKKHHMIQHDTEPLMDILPLTDEDLAAFGVDESLMPIDSDMEQSLEHSLNKFYTQEGHSDEYHAKVPMMNIANTMFIGEMQVGSNKGANSFDVIYDTGSALTCIASEQCKDIGCMKSKRYDRTQSHSFHEIGKQVEIVFGSGTLRGLINKEQIRVDGMDLKDALFIEITTQIGDAFHSGEFDGIVGLGFPHMTGVPTIFDYMINQHKLHKNQFTFHLNRELGNSGSQIIFGGHDDKLVQEGWRYHNVEEKFYWSIMASEIKVGGQNTHICSESKKCKMVVDTGTTLLTGPTGDVRKLLSMIRVAPKCQNFNEMPDITIVFDKHEYVLTPHDYILTITSKGVEPPYEHSQQSEIVGCVGTLFPLDLPPKQGPLWILGDIFITKYSAIFDRDHNRVGLALNKHYKA